MEYASKLTIEFGCTRANVDAIYLSVSGDESAGDDSLFLGRGPAARFIAFFTAGSASDR